MNPTRRQAVKAAGGAGLFALLAAAGFIRPGEALAQAGAFEVKTVPEAMKVLGAQNPADSAAILPPRSHNAHPTASTAVPNGMAVFGKNRSASNSRTVAAIETTQAIAAAQHMPKRGLLRWIDRRKREGKPRFSESEGPRPSRSAARKC